MQPYPPEELEKLIRDLSSGLFPATRRKAAERLGQVSTTSESIVQALAIAEVLDESPEVRGAARDALFTPVHAAWIVKNPEVLKKAVEHEKWTRKEKHLVEVSNYSDDFLRRRRRERLYYLFVFLIVFVMPFGYITFSNQGWLKGSSPSCGFEIAVMVVAGFWMLLSVRNWRCPACDSWLGGWKGAIHPFFSSPPIYCPHCGKKILG